MTFETNSKAHFAVWAVHQGMFAKAYLPSRDQQVIYPSGTALGLNNSPATIPETSDLVSAQLLNFLLGPFFDKSQVNRTPCNCACQSIAEA